MQPILQDKCMVQPLIKKMRMTGNIAKRKMVEEEPSEDNRELEAFSNEKHFVEFGKYGSGKIIISS